MNLQPLQRRDFLGVACYCLVLYAVVLGVGGPLTMHEGVLSQTSRQMCADHDWVVPHYGQAPWLERPPLPQWITVGLAQLVGSCDREWVVRIGPALSGTITVLLTTWLAGAFFGRALGLLSGLILATMYNFVRYATLAEADMFLCPIVAGTLCLFAYLELLRPEGASDGVHFLGRRPWPVFWFFFLLGMTELAKGLVFGTVMTLVPIGGYLLWHFGWRSLGRYCWLWGWLLFAAITLAWPLAVYQRYPDALEVWHFDLFARLHSHYLEEPAWYYLGNWFWVVLPWPLFGLLGLGLTARSAFTERASPYRLLWCWAILPPAFFSMAHGKHHHYMIHFLAPWAILAATGVRWTWDRAQAWPAWARRPLALPIAIAVLGDAAFGAAFALLGDRIPGASWLLPTLLAAWPVLAWMSWWSVFHRRGAVALVAGFLLLLGLYVAGFAYKSAYLHRSNDDTAFVREARALVPAGRPLLIHSDPEALEGLRVLFYCDRSTILLHNLSFLHDERLAGPSVYLIARVREAPRLEPFGAAEMLLQSKQSRREESPKDRWTLFRVHLRDDLHRRPASVRITPMQAMYRAPGPNLD